jgi:hypothetical protein
MAENSTWRDSRIQLTSVRHDTDYRCRSSSPPKPISASQLSLAREVFAISPGSISAFAPAVVPISAFCFPAFCSSLGLLSAFPISTFALRVSSLLYENEVIRAILFVARSELPTMRTAPVPTTGLTRFMACATPAGFRTTRLRTPYESPIVGKLRSDPDTGISGSLALNVVLPQDLHPLLVLLESSPRRTKSLSTRIGFRCFRISMFM